MQYISSPHPQCYRKTLATAETHNSRAHRGVINRSGAQMNRGALNGEKQRETII